jgi:hypothetical protein
MEEIINYLRNKLALSQHQLALSQQQVAELQQQVAQMQQQVAQMQQQEVDLALRLMRMENGERRPPPSTPPPPPAQQPLQDQLLCKVTKTSVCKFFSTNFKKLILIVFNLRSISPPY